MVKKPTKTKAKNTKSIKHTPHLYKERRPDCHDITGKYIFLYMFFAICTLVFALTTIFFYSAAHDIISRYDNFIRRTQENNTTQKEEENNE